MSMYDAFLQEFENEAGTTRRVLERVPSDKLEWKPHPKSMSLGVLALHVAGSPGVICGWAAEDETQFKGEPSPTPTSTEQILAAHDNSVKTTKEILGTLGDEGLKGMWSGEGRRRDVDVDAESDPGPRHRPEPLDPPSRAAVGVPPPARRAGAVDLRPERRREPVRRAHVEACSRRRSAKALAERTTLA